MVLFAVVSNPWTLVLIGVGAIKLAIDGERLFYLRDAILKQLYEQNRALWYQLGKPTGRIWRPPGEKGNVLRGAFHRPLWIAGSKIEEDPRVRDKFQSQMAVGRQLVRLDVPLLVIAFVLTFVFIK